MFALGRSPVLEKALAPTVGAVVPRNVTEVRESDSLKAESLIEVTAEGMVIEERPVL